VPDISDKDGDDVEIRDKAPSGELMGVLAHPLRRDIMRYLIERNEKEADLGEIVKYLSGRDANPDQSINHEQIALKLHHVHLPKMGEAGVIDYDHAERTVEYHGEDSRGRYLKIFRAE
jgi:hypothetical protein